MLSSCSMPKTPEEFFGIAILNTNLINDFASPRLGKRIQEETLEFADIPSSKKKGNEAFQNVQTTVLILEQNLQKVKDLPDNDSTKAMKDEAVALYEYVIPVYKNEYTAYAKLCDAKGPQDQKASILESIDKKYAAEFERKYSSLLQKGKAYAEKHNLNVNWD